MYITSIFCDRCNKPIQSRDYNCHVDFTYGEERFPHANDWEYITMRNGGFDLCPDCTHNLIRFLTKKEVNDYENN